MSSNDISIRRALEGGVISITGEFLWGSNYTFAVEVSHDGQILGIYIDGALLGVYIYGLNRIEIHATIRKQ